mmetsp:Transcript_25260/g.57547  ORF Transcript_25260/g.57547 Transcript_25260/m.57547 type:complete len:207 (+) Transcript_25260:349-969(+)
MHKTSAHTPISVRGGGRRGCNGRDAATVLSIRSIISCVRPSVLMDATAWAFTGGNDGASSSDDDGGTTRRTTFSGGSGIDIGRGGVFNGTGSANGGSGGGCMGGSSGSVLGSGGELGDDGCGLGAGDGTTGACHNVWTTAGDAVGAGGTSRTVAGCRGVASGGDTGGGLWTLVREATPGGSGGQLGRVPSLSSTSSLPFVQKWQRR